MPVMGSSTAVIDWVVFVMTARIHGARCCDWKEITLLILGDAGGRCFRAPRFSTINAYQTFLSTYIHYLGYLSALMQTRVINQTSGSVWFSRENRLFGGVRIDTPILSCSMSSNSFLL